ncbi:MAG: hypothetical protein JW795_12155 [Chitinivibrionales bacterium]|nr:hypothetical protein [Chitinivibrionales bacterium]
MKNLKNVLNKPLHDCRLWVLWIWNKTISEEELTAQLTAYIDAGFGGVAIRPGRDMSPAYLSEEFYALMHKVLTIASEKNIHIRLADDFSLSWDLFFHKQAEKNSLYRSQKIHLEKSVVITAKDTFECSSADMEQRIVLAVRLNEKKMDHATVRHISAGQKNSDVSWKSPGGDWQLLIFKKSWCLDPLGHFLPNVFNPKVAILYIQEVLEPITAAFEKYVPATFEGFIGEVPSSVPSETGIPWDDDLIIKYRSRYKKNLVDILPSLFFDVDDSNAKNRSHIYNFLLQSMYERFASILEVWGQKKQFTQWLLCPERDITWSEHALKDVMAIAPADFRAVGIQNQEGTEKNSPIIRILSDSNRVEFNRETIGVIGRNRLNESATLQSLKYEIDYWASCGVSKVILDGSFFNIEQRSYIKTPFNHGWYHPEWQQIRHLCDYCQRLLSLYKSASRDSGIAIVFPASSLMADYLPTGDSLLRKGLQVFSDVIGTLRARNIDFDVISEQVLLDSAAKSGGDVGVTKPGKKENYTLLIFPYARLINNSVFVFLEKLVNKKGIVVFIDEPPQGNFDDGKSPSFDSRVGKLIRPKNETVHVVNINDLISIIEELQKVIFTRVGGKPCNDIKSISTGYGVGQSIHHFINDSTTRDYFVTVEFPETEHVYSIDCTSGELAVLDIAARNEGYSVVELDFAPRQSYLLVTTTAKGPQLEAETTAASYTTKQRNYRVVLKDKWAFTALSFNGMPLANLSKRIGLSRDSGGFSYYYETYFEIEEIPQTCILVFFEPQTNSTLSHLVVKDLEVSVNGIVVSAFKEHETLDGTLNQNGDIAAFFGKSILKFMIKDTIMKGINRVAIRNVGLTGEPRPILFPPVVAGNFSIKKGSRGWTINSLTTEANYGTWTKHGFPYLSGVGLYHQIFEIPSEYERIILKLNQTSGCVSVDVNDVSLGMVRWQPMGFDITKHVEQRRNSIKIRVVNTIDNMVQMKTRSSGLIGEVFLDIY